MRTGVADRVILRMVRRIGGSALFVPPAMFVLFSLAGAVFGFSEGAIPCAMLVIPLLIAMDFDAITGVLCTFAATQVGVACAWMGIGALESAQTIAGIPVLSGARLRMVLWAVLTALGAGYTAIYASRVYEDPHRSLTHAGDARFRGRFESLRARREPFTLGAKLVAAAVLLSLGWMVWGVMTLNYTLDEIASLFFVMALITGLLGAAFHLDGMQLRDIPRAFQSGASDLVGAVLVMGMAQGMVLLMGGINPTSPSVLNTLLHWAERAFSELPGLLAAWLMYVFQYGVNVVVPSEVGQAALTMPVMAPLADGLGISRQVAVLAFQLGGQPVPSAGADFRLPDRGFEHCTRGMGRLAAFPVESDCDCFCACLGGSCRRRLHRVYVRFWRRTKRHGAQNPLFCAISFAIMILRGCCRLGRKTKYERKRKICLAPGIYPDFGRMRHRHRQRMAVPIYYRSVRRRSVCAGLSAVPYYSGIADHGDGVRGGPRPANSRRRARSTFWSRRAPNGICMAMAPCSATICLWHFTPRLAAG